MKRKPAMAAVIRSEMTAVPTVAPPRIGGRRSPESVHLREYQDGNSTAEEMVAGFLQEVYHATRADVSGATGLAWDTLQRVFDKFEKAGQLRINKAVSPWEYSWK